LSPSPPPTWKIGSILAIGMLALSTGAVLVRCTTATAGVSHLGFSLVIGACRLTLASLMLLPQLWLSGKPIPWHNTRAIGTAAAAGIALTLHFATWVSSLSYTSIATSSVLVTTTPIWTALFCGLVLRETIRRQTLLGIGVAFGGGLLIAMDNVPTIAHGQPLLGNGLALLGAITGTAYLLLGRSAQQRGLITHHYILLAYGVAAMVLLPLPILLGTPYLGYPIATYGWFLLIAIVPQLLGHTSFNWAMRHIAPTLVTLAILAEPIGASILGYLIFHEVPSVQTLQGCGLILLGIAIASLVQPKSNI
jgi:drug/metabolite transporter (DMT)-like permease